MHILILAPTAGAAEKIQTALSSIAHRPDLILVERGSLAQMELATLSSLTEPGRWPPLLLVDRPTPGMRDGVAAVQHLARAPMPPHYQIGDLRVDTRKKRAGLGERWVTLPPIQYRLLLALAKQASEVVGYRELMREVWGYEGEDSEARELLKVHVRQIRRRLGLDPEKSYYIRSVRGFGYMLVSPDEED
jgi:DNA-binding winged helix-turn-helix (wHTH) protein